MRRERKEGAQSAKSADKDKAIISLNSAGDKTFVCCMDLQAVLLTPRIKAISLYYKTKLRVHHFTFYNLAIKDVLGYVWHEGEGALTAHEFASCVAILDFQSTSCIAMGAPIRTEIPLYQTPCYILLSRTTWR